MEGKLAELQIELDFLRVTRFLGALALLGAYREPTSLLILDPPSHRTRALYPLEEKDHVCSGLPGWMYCLLLKVVSSDMEDVTLSWYRSLLHA